MITERPEKLPAYGPLFSNHLLSVFAFPLMSCSLRSISLSVALDDALDKTEENVYKFR